MPGFLRGSARPQDNPKLRKVLNAWQVFFITISGIIGTGLFSTNGGILTHAGPGGYILALGVVGMIALCFMDGLSEMVQAFPCANALSEYVEVFVDADLASCVGIAYWLVWGIFWALMINGAAGDVLYWNDDLTLRVTVFLIICPLAMIALNLCSVSFFGWVETIAGGLKILAIIAVSLSVFYLAGKSGNALANIDRGFQGRDPTDVTGYNICAALPMVAYSWNGMEIVAVTAYEAKRLKALRAPSQAVVFVILILYLICAIGESLAIGADNSELPGNRLIPQNMINLVDRTTEAIPQGPIRTNALIVLAAVHNGEPVLAGLFNGILIFCAISAGNTSLYVASRALYGFALKKKAKGYVGMDILSRVNRFGVPWCSVLVTAGVFVWIPFLQLSKRPAGLEARQAAPAQYKKPQGTDEYAQWLGTVASLLGLIVWLSEMLAYIRYYHWLRMYRTQSILTKEYPRLNRFASTGRARTLLGFAQPYLAYVGFAATFVVVAGFSSASWWHEQNPRAFEVTQTFAAPVLMLLAWLLLKLRRYRSSSIQHPFEWYSKRKTGIEGLREVLDDMLWLSGERPHANTGHEEAQPTFHDVDDHDDDDDNVEPDLEIKSINDPSEESRSTAEDVHGIFSVQAPSDEAIRAQHAGAHGDMIDHSVLHL